MSIKQHVEILEPILLDDGSGEILTRRVKRKDKRKPKSILKPIERSDGRTTLVYQQCTRTTRKRGR